MGGAPQSPLWGTLIGVQVIGEELRVHLAAQFREQPANVLVDAVELGELLDQARYALIERLLGLGEARCALRQVLVGNDRVTLDIVLVKQNDKIRIWSSLFPDGTALVEDGVMTSATGRETRWMTHCP